eukprot:GHVN01039780.1.p1 GENE.GHVN01039780.1~~GHVN01039780.1.p1  ORF type:complete len:1041 (+),score=285.01 GHVN01039780.1:108-3230(+)
MVKTYLRYECSSSFGVITSSHCNGIFTLDGKRVVNGSNESVTISHTKIGLVEKQLTVPTSFDLEIPFHHQTTYVCRHPINPRIIAAGYSDGSVRLWESAPHSLQGEVIVVFHGHKSAITKLEFSINGHFLLSGSNDTDIVLWDCVSQCGVSRFRGHSNKITDLKFIYNTNIIHSVDDDDEDGDEMRDESVNDEDDREGEPTAKRQKKENEKRKNNDDETNKKINKKIEKASKKESSTSSSSPSLISLNCSPRYLVSSSSDNFVKLWEIESQWCVYTLTDHPTPVWSLYVSTDQLKLITGSADEYYRIYSIQTGGDVEPQSESLQTPGSRVSEVSGPGTTETGEIDNLPTRNQGVGSMSQSVSQSVGRGLGLIFLGSVKRQATGGRVMGLVPVTAASGYGADAVSGVSQSPHSDTPTVSEIVCEVSPTALLAFSDRRQVEVIRLFTPIEQLKRQKRRKRRIKEKLNKKITQLTEIQAMEYVVDRRLGLKKKSQPETANSSTDTATRIRALKEEIEEIKKTGFSPKPVISDFFTILGVNTLKNKILFLDYCSRQHQVILGFNDNSYEVHKIKTDLLLRQTSEADEKSLDSLPHQLGLVSRVSQHGHAHNVQSLAVSHDDAMLLSVAPQCIKVWSLGSCKCVSSVPITTGLCGFFVTGNTHAVFGTKEGTVELLSIETARVVQTDKSSHSGAVQSLRENPKRTGFASVGTDKRLCFFSLFTTLSQSIHPTVSESISETMSHEGVGFELTRIFDLSDQAVDLEYTPDGKLIAVSLLDNTIQVYFTDSLKLFLTLYGHKLPCPSITISSDSTILASGSSDKSIKIWGLDFGNIQKSWHAHEGAVTNVKFMHDTHYLISTGHDGFVKTWDCDTKALITQLAGHHQRITSITVTQDADRIITSGIDRSIRVWRRTEEQMFIAEEREKELDARLEEDAAREDRDATLAVSDARPTRRTIETISGSERLMKVIDDAYEQWQDREAYQALLVSWSEEQSTVPVSLRQPRPTPPPHSTSHHEALMTALTRIPVHSVEEVLIALPFLYVEKL